jgi:ABC-type Zn2+ transport system substrate-binding protein/surface adhesin
MKEQQTKCLFHTNEINFEKTKVITEDTAIIRAEINILGNELESGPDQYFKLMKNLTSQIAQCLQ